MECYLYEVGNILKGQFLWSQVAKVFTNCDKSAITGCNFFNESVGMPYAVLQRSR